MSSYAALFSVLAVTQALHTVHADSSTFSAGSGAANGKTAVLWNATWTDRLKHDLLMKYDKFARPAQHTNITEVLFGILIKHVEVDEVRAMMTLNALTRLKWNDEKLKWNASDYGNLSKLSVSDHEVWQPDVVLYNSALGNSVEHYGNTHCLVWQDGQVLWVPPSQFSVYCDINLRKWPYDTHTCYFFFGSWVYDGEQINLKKYVTSESLLDMEPCEWTVVNVTELEHIKYYNCCSEPYYNIEVVITVERRSPAYAAITLTPALVCAVLTLAVFWLPPGASEKYLLSGVTAVIICMFLLYFAQRLPAMGTHTPLIVEFYAYNLLLVCVSVVLSVVTGSLRQRPRINPAPRILGKMLNSHLGTFLGVSNAKNPPASLYAQQDQEELQECRLVERSRTESVDTSAASPPINYAKEWILIAIALDRIMFFVYLLIFLFIASAFYLS